MKRRLRRPGTASTTFLIFNVPQGMHLALQFKAARPHPKDGNPFFQFRISELQHSVYLLRLAKLRPALCLLPYLAAKSTRSKACVSLNFA